MAHIPLTYLGTALSNGQPRITNGTGCTQYFDNAGFMIGSSAALFNAVQSGFSSTTIINLISDLLNDITSIQPTNFSVPLVANYPNSFGNFTPSSSTTFESADNDILEIVDGGEDGQNVPLFPLLVKARAIDMIVAIDSSADTEFSWPNGTSLLATADRVANFTQGFASFPQIPSNAQQFVEQGLDVRPTFFGCNVTGNGNVTTADGYPIIIYLPNAPVAGSSYSTNTSTFQLNYSNEDTVNFLNNAHQNALKGFPDPNNANESRDPNWPIALKCATIDRARQRAGIARSSVCEQQFSRYCWSPEIAQQLTNITASTGGNLGNTGGNAPASAASSIQTTMTIVLSLTAAVFTAMATF